MPGFCIQFHATHEEILQFAERWILNHGLHVAENTCPPWRVATTDISGVRTMPSPGSPGPYVRWLIFNQSAMDMTMTDRQGEFCDRNPNRLDLHIGRVTDEELFESCLSTLVDSTVWKSLARQLRSATMKGVYPGHRYTQGAESLAQQGLRMLTFTGVPLDLPSVHS